MVEAQRLTTVTLRTICEERQDVSRVLSTIPEFRVASHPSSRRSMGGYLSGTIVTDRLKRLSKRDRQKTNPRPLPCFRPGFTEPAPLDAAGALLPHLCTLTERDSLEIRAPKTTPRQKTQWIAVDAARFYGIDRLGGIFLWHYPHDRSHWALPSKPSLSEARTFLRQQ